MKRKEKVEKQPKKTATNLDVVDRVGLERVDHVRELHPVSDEKHRHVVAHQVPVALPGVKLDSEPARVADCLGRAALVDDGREARDDGRLRARGAEEVGAGKVRDVVGGLEEALGRGAAGVDDALRDALAVELFLVVQFFFFFFEVSVVEGVDEVKKKRNEEKKKQGTRKQKTSHEKPKATHVRELFDEVVVLEEDRACVFLCKRGSKIVEVEK